MTLLQRIAFYWNALFIKKEPITTSEPLLSDKEIRDSLKNATRLQKLIHFKLCYKCKTKDAHLHHFLAKKLQRLSPQEIDEKIKKLLEEKGHHDNT